MVAKRQWAEWDVTLAQTSPDLEEDAGHEEGECSESEGDLARESAPVVRIRRKVVKIEPSVTVITDIDLQDDASLDKHFRFHYERGTTMLGLRTMIRDHQIEIYTKLVWLQVGNCEIPLSKHVSPVNQLKKLVSVIIRTCPLLVWKIYVAGILPRPDREVELEQDVRQANRGFAQAVQDLKKHHHVGRRVVFVQVYWLFLEKFKFCDLTTGQKAAMTRIVKPVDRFFVAGTPKLNLVGKYHLKSYMLQYMDVLEGVNSWSGIPVVEEPEELQKQKKQAWLLAHSQALGAVEQSSAVLDESDDTDVEDENRDQGACGHESMARVPVVVRGWATEPFDANLDFDVMVTELSQE